MGAPKYMLIATCLFSLMQICVKAIPRIPAHEIVFFRALISLVMCFVMLRREGVSPIGNAKGLLLARGVAGTIALTLFFHTLQVMPLASAATVQYLSPMFTLLIAGVMLNEPTRKIQILCFAIAFSGIALIKGFDSRVRLEDVSLGVVGAIFSGIAYNLVRKLKGTDHPLVVVFYFPLVVVPVVGSYSLFHWVRPMGWEWGWLIAVGVLTQYAQVFMTRAYQLERADRVAQYSYFGAVFAVLSGYFFFGELLPPGAFGGLGLILTGVVLSTYVARDTKGASPERK